MESHKLLAAENERLQSEISTLQSTNEIQMASLKKKIKLAMKKQLAELRAKIQAAEQRANAAEAALNGHVSDPNSGSGVNGGGVSSFAPPGQLPSTEASAVPRDRLLRVDSSDGEIVHPLSLSADEDFLNFQSSMEILPAEVKSEREHSRGRADEAAKETQRLENELVELKKTKGEERAKLEEELRLVKEDAEHRVGLLTKANEKLEIQLMGAAGQVSEAFTRMSATQDDMERLSKEGHEAKRAHSALASEHAGVKKDLEETRSSLAEMQQKLQDKTKENEDMAAARRAAQEGQEAAMSQLILRLDEMEASGTGKGADLHLREVNEDRVQSLLQEKAELVKELERSSQTLASLRDEVTAYRQGVVDHNVQEVGTIDPNQVDDSIFQNKSLLLQEQIKPQPPSADSWQPEAKELRGVAQMGEFVSVQEFSSLTEKWQESTATQQAAEKKIEHLSLVVTEAEQQAVTLSQELAEVRRNMEDEIKLRDENFVQLEAKFGRLQKRAKQRIQEVQKEKEEVEMQLSAAVEKASQALSRQAAIQDDLDRARLQAGEALRTLDAERQQLRAANVKLREDVEDLRRTLHGREHDLAESRRTALEKEQNIVDMTAMLREAETSHEATVSDLKDKYQRMEENFKAQLADATSETSKMVETISALHAQLGVKESKLAELDAASSGEVVRLNASLEAVKGDVSRLELEHTKEKDAWQVRLETLDKKLEDAEKVIDQQEVATTKLRRQLESELEQQHQLLSIAAEDLSNARNETSRMASDFAAYKLRAYALLQKKEAELLAAKDSEFATAQETALKNAKREAVIASAERDSAVKALQDAVSEYEIKLMARDVSLLDAEHRIRDLATKLEASKGQLFAEQDEWRRRLEQIEAMKRESLEESIPSSVEADLRQENSELLKDYSDLKAEYDSFRDLVDTMIGEKDKEVARLLEDNANLQRSSCVETKSPSEEKRTYGKATENLDLDSTVVAVAEQQILILARQQAQREEEVSQCRRHIQALQEEITDLEHENRLHSQQEALLKEELRNLERGHKRDGVDMTYLKNVILKLLETGEVEALLPVVAMLLQFSPEELKRCHDTYNSATTNNIPLSGAAAVVDNAVSTPRAFFSRLNFAGGN